jgi:putative transcriptional regulator
MAKKKGSGLFNDLMQAANETLAFVKGEADAHAFRIFVPEKIDVKAVRKELRLTQGEFADCFGFTTARVRDWEQERSAPDPAIRAYLKVICHSPDKVMSILAKKDIGARGKAVSTSGAKAKLIMAASVLRQGSRPRAGTKKTLSRHRNGASAISGR